MDRAGEPLDGIYGRYDGESAAVGVSLGAVSRIDGDCGREIVEEADEAGWYDLLGEMGLEICTGELGFLKRTRRAAVFLGESSLGGPSLDGGTVWGALIGVLLSRGKVLIADFDLSLAIAFGLGV